MCACCVQDVAGELDQYFTFRGYRVFLDRKYNLRSESDEHSDLPGYDLMHSVQQCRVFVFIISPRMFDQESKWCRFELESDTNKQGR